MKKRHLLKTMLLLFALIVGSSSAWAIDYEELFSISSASVVTNSGYSAYNTTVDNRDYVITYGGNNKSVGTNSNNRKNCKLTNYSKYAVSPVTTSSIASAFACKTSISNVTKISYTFNGGSNQTSTKVYLLYSSDNTTFAQVPLTAGTQGATISSGTNYEFNAKTGYFALLFVATNTSGAWRIDDVEIKFFKTSESSVAAPKFSVPEGPVERGTQVELTSTTGGASIYYTTDGTTPTSYSELYSDAITINSATTINAIAIKDNEASTVSTANYTIKKVETPTFSLNQEATSGTYVTSGSAVELLSNTSGAVIHYTIDGTDPSASSPVYSSAITINATTTIKAIAVKSNWDDSDIASAEFVLFAVEDGVFNFVAAGTVGEDYDSGVEITSNSQTYVTSEKTWTAGNVTMVTKGKYRWWSDKTLRFYNNNPASSATFSVPNGYVITKIVSDGKGDNPYFSNADNGTLSGDTWTGAAQSVKLSTGDTGVNFKSFTVTYSAVPENVTATIASSGYTTYCSPYDLSFEGVENLEAAYVVTTSTSSSAKLTKVTAAPAGTGVILKGTTGAVSIPVAEYTGSGISNILVGTLNATPVTAETVYVVSGGKFMLFAGTEIPANKAYLPASELTDSDSAPSLSFDFGGDTTGINSVERGALSVEGCYTLDGRRVAQPTKGLYIVNGKKVVIK